MLMCILSSQLQGAEYVTSCLCSRLSKINRKGILSCILAYNIMKFSKIILICTGATFWTFKYLSSCHTNTTFLWFVRLYFPLNLISDCWAFFQFSINYDSWSCHFTPLASSSKVRGEWIWGCSGRERRRPWTQGTRERWVKLCKNWLQFC